MKIVEQTAEKLKLKYLPAYKSLGPAMIGIGTVGLSLFKLFMESSITLFSQVFLISFVVVGAVLATSAVMTWTFDKSQDEIQLKSKSVRVNKVAKYRLSSISSVQVEQNPAVYIRNGMRHKTWRILFVFTDLTSISLTHSKLPVRYETSC